MLDHSWIKDIKQGDTVYVCRGLHLWPQLTTVAKTTKLYLFLENGLQVRILDGQGHGANYRGCHLVPNGSELALKADKRELCIKMENWLNTRSLDELLAAANKLGI